MVEAPEVEEIAEKSEWGIETMPELPAELDDPSVFDAVAAYQAQALADDPAAQLKLGLAYYKGRSVPANPKLASFWVMRSVLAGSYRAAKFFKYCAELVPPGERGRLRTCIFLWAPGQPVPQL